MTLASPTLPNDGETIDAIDVNGPFNAILGVINGNIDSTNVSSLLGTKLTPATVPLSAIDAASTLALAGGWNSIAVPPTTIVNNGQRSQTLTFPGVDYTDRLNPGTRLRTTRTVAAPVQSTALNGTTQYWNMVAPNKMTFINNFTTMGWIKLASYSSSAIVSRMDSTGANGWGTRLTADGRLELILQNAGSSNYRSITSYQSLPLNKWVHFAVAYTGGGSCAIYMDGISVPVANATTGGTAPTDCAVGGDFAIGRMGSYTSGFYFGGKLGQIAVFNTVPSAATIQSYMSQGYLGTETSLVSAYSFNGVATDLMTTTPNNLTAQGSAGYIADSPFGTQASGLISSTLDYAIVSSATFSTNTTVVVQVPEGCTIPTSGGVSAVSYSGQKAPYGFPASAYRWTQVNIFQGTGSIGIATGSIAGAWGAFLNSDMSLPVGIWRRKSMVVVTGTCTTASSMTTQTQWDIASPFTDLQGQHRDRANVASNFSSATHRHEDIITIATATTYKLWGAITGGAGTQSAYFENGTKSYLSHENALL